MSTENKKTPIYSLSTIELLENIAPISRDKAFLAACRECVDQQVGVSAMRESLKEYSLGVSNKVASAVHSALVDKADLTDAELLTLIEKVRKEVAAESKAARDKKKAEAAEAEAKKKAEAEAKKKAEAEENEQGVKIDIMIVAAINAATQVGLTPVQIANAIANATAKKVAQMQAKKVAKKTK